MSDPRTWQLLTQLVAQWRARVTKEKADIAAKTSRSLDWRSHPRTSVARAQGKYAAFEQCADELEMALAKFREAKECDRLLDEYNAAVLKHSAEVEALTRDRAVLQQQLEESRRERLIWSNEARMLRKDLARLRTTVATDPALAKDTGF